MIPRVEPTCTEDGNTSGVYCGTCNIVLEPQKTIPANGHTRESIPEVKPTCTEEGSTGGAKCSVCGVELEAPAIRSPLGHEYYDNDCKRCDAKKWWVDFFTTRTSFELGEHMDISFVLHTSEKGATTKLYYNAKYEYSSGKTSWTDKEVFRSGKAHSEGAHRSVYWDGFSSPATVTLYIYDGDGHTLGSYTFKVK